MSTSEFPREAELKELEKKISKLQKEKKRFQEVRTTISGLDAQQVILDYIKRLECFCEQGGTGYAFYYAVPMPDGSKLTSPHHWVVKPEHYDKTTPSREEQKALTFKRFDPKFWFKIASSSQTEHWGN
jgi:hypothetical protein